MVFLGYRKYVRSDRIYALEAIRDGRGAGRRTLVWVEGIADPIVASRTERAILFDMGQGAAAETPLLEQALALAKRVAEAAEKVGPLLARSLQAESGVDLPDLGRRARRLLESTAPSREDPQLF
jgi:hypothetical protein